MHIHQTITLFPAGIFNRNRHRHQLRPTADQTIQPGGDCIEYARNKLYHNIHPSRQSAHL
jgi:hypothetical protein